MRAATWTVPTGDGDMALYEAVPDDPPRGGLVVVQEAYGVNDHIRDVTRRAAAAGYHAVAPDLFHRVGGGAGAYGDVAGILPKFEGLGDEGILADVDAATAALRDTGLPDGRIGVVGFCFGGRAAFLVALRRALGAAVTFYGGGVVSPGFLNAFPPLVDEAASLRTPWLGLYGDLDRSIPPDDVERLREAVAAAPVDTEVVRYPDAGHGFHCDARPDHRPDAATDAWQRTLAWLDAHLG